MWTPLLIAFNFKLLFFSFSKNVCDLLALHALIKKSSEFEQETFSVESFELKLDADMELDD